nr:FHA domain-containing protein [uncultured Blautia sp.]
MEFIYDFTDGHTVFSYVSKENEALDTESWTVISSGAVSRNLLPVFMRKENDGYSFTYDIAGMINMMAWKDGQTVNEQMETDRKIEAAVQEVLRKGIPRGEILTEKQYIYVEVSTGEIKLICIPVREEQGDDFSAGTGKAPGRTSAAPLPLIPPEPRGDMPGDIFIEKPAERKSRWWRRKSSEGRRHKERENILIPPVPEEPVYDRREVDQDSTDWQERGFSQQIGKNDPEKDIWKKTETQDEFPYRDSRSRLEIQNPWEQSEAANPWRAPEEQKPWNQPETVNPRREPEEQKPWNQPETVNPWGGSEIQKPLERSAQSEPWHQKGNLQIPVSVQTSDEPAPEQNFSDDDSETVLLRDDGDSETVLLRQPQKIAAKLLRINTQEVFSVTTENCKIGKRALMTDICIRNNPTVSREHCVIRFRDGEYYIEDMDSSNYTYLNGIRVMPGHPKKLQEEDRIRLSDEEFIFRKGE